MHLLFLIPTCLTPLHYRVWYNATLSLPQQSILGHLTFKFRVGSYPLTPKGRHALPRKSKHQSPNPVEMSYLPKRLKRPNVNPTHFALLHFKTPTEKWRDLLCDPATSHAIGAQWSVQAATRGHDLCSEVCRIDSN